MYIYYKMANFNSVDDLANGHIDDEIQSSLLQNKILQNALHAINANLVRQGFQSIVKNLSSSHIFCPLIWRLLSNQIEGINPHWLNYGDPPGSGTDVFPTRIRLINRFALYNADIWDNVIGVLMNHCPEIITWIATSMVTGLVDADPFVENGVVANETLLRLALGYDGGRRSSRRKSRRSSRLKNRRSSRRV